MLCSLQADKEAENPLAAALISINIQAIQTLHGKAAPRGAILPGSILFAYCFLYKTHITFID